MGPEALETGSDRTLGEQLALSSLLGQFVLQGPLLEAQDPSGARLSSTGHRAPCDAAAGMLLGPE